MTSIFRMSFILLFVFMCSGYSSDSSLTINHERQREQVAKTKIPLLEGEIAQLRQSLELAREQTLTLNRQVYQRAGMTEADVEPQWSQISKFVESVDAISQAQWAVISELETAVVGAESSWGRLKGLPVVKLYRTDTLTTLAEQGVLRVRRMLDVAIQKARQDSLARIAAALADTVVPEAPQPPPPVIVQAPPPPIPVVEPPPPIPERSSFDGQVYRVGKASDRKDGTLWEIAAIVYKDPSKWQRLWRANKDKIKNPDRIVPGMVLIVPSGPVPK